MDFAKTSWMREDRDDSVKKMLEAGRMAEEIKQNKGRYKILADLIAGKSADITQDGLIFATINRPRSLEDDERLTLEEYMKFYPQQCEDAMEMAANRRSADERDYNPHSQAKWRQQGYMPECVAKLLMDSYPQPEDRKRAIKRFFNMFPKFRISSKAI